MVVDIQLKEWYELYKRVLKLPDEIQSEIVIESADVTMAYFDSYARSKYPPPVKRKKVARYWTNKQRRWWWYTMRKKALGEAPLELIGWNAVYKEINGVKVLDISGSYKRTNTMIKSLTWELVEATKEVVAEYGTKTDYAKYVIGSDSEQSEYHKGNWSQLEKLLQNYTPQLALEFKNEVEKRVDDYLEKR